MTLICSLQNPATLLKGLRRKRSFEVAAGRPRLRILFSFIWSKLASPTCGVLPATRNQTRRGATPAMSNTRTHSNRRSACRVARHVCNIRMEGSQPEFSRLLIHQDSNRSSAKDHSIAAESSPPQITRKEIVSSVFTIAASRSLHRTYDERRRNPTSRPPRRAKAGRCGPVMKFQSLRSMGNLGASNSWMNPAPTFPPRARLHARTWRTILANKRRPCVPRP